MDNSKMLKLTLKQKIDLGLTLRRKSLSELCAVTGIQGWKIRTRSIEGKMLTCGEVNRIARFLEAVPMVVIRDEEGTVLIERRIVSDSDTTEVATRQIGEMFGLVCELEFWMEDIGRRL